MKAGPECFPCALNQVLRLMRAVKMDDETILDAIKEAWEYIKGLDLNYSPAYIATRSIRTGSKYFPVEDPYLDFKREHNEIALRVLEEVKERVEGAEDPLKFRLILMASGNIIDLGTQDRFDLVKTLEANFNAGFGIDHYEIFKDKLRDTKKFMLIADNAGEVVFDIYFLKKLDVEDRILVVKSGPVLNDVTRYDLEGLDTSGIRVIETGSNALGVDFRETSEEFMEEFNSSDIVLAKGHANFETLDDAPREVFLLLQIKCQVVSRRLGKPVGTPVFALNTLI